MKHTRLTSAFILTVLVAANPVFAETEPAGPRLLILSQTDEATLPGALNGERHGVKVNRGSGFPEPVIVQVQETEEVTKPAPVTPRRVVRRASRW